MLALIKTFGKGLLYILLLPFILLVIALGAIYAVIIFFIMLIRSIIMYFKGKTIFSPLPEELEAAHLLQQEAKHKTPPISEPIHEAVLETNNDSVELNNKINHEEENTNE